MSHSICHNDVLTISFQHGLRLQNLKTYAWKLYSAGRALSDACTAIQGQLVVILQSLNMCKLYFVLLLPCGGMLYMLFNCLKPDLLNGLQFSPVMKQLHLPRIPHVQTRPTSSLAEGQGESTRHGLSGLATSFAGAKAYLDNSICPGISIHVVECPICNT